MEDILQLIGRESPLFEEDIHTHFDVLSNCVKGASFLVLGGAGSIGQAVVKEIFKRSPAKLHVVDISENNLVELVRDLRSSFGYIEGDFRTFCLDIGSTNFNVFIESDGQFDYVLNLSALKHVRSERDPFTLMRMIDVNITNTVESIRFAKRKNSRKYFCVSTDKAANPVNMMGASKRIMEHFLMRESKDTNVSTARFANVAFSDGSLLQGFSRRLEKNQPIVAPNDVKRYFVTPQESGELCLLSCLLGENRDIFFPKLTESLHLITFADIAERYLAQRGYEPYLCVSEEEARRKVAELPRIGKWPCLWSSSDTTGEKDFEEFYTDSEVIDMDRFTSIGVVSNQLSYDEQVLKNFESGIQNLKQKCNWNKQDILALFQLVLPDFSHIETGKYLDSKM